MGNKRHIVVAALATVVLAGTAWAANTQVNPNSWKAAGRSGHVYGRSDGVFQEQNSKAPYIIENGTAAKSAGFGYSESFTPGVVATVPSAFMTIAGLVQSASAQQLNIGYFGPHAFIFAQATAQTVLPTMGSLGLDISGDEVNGESYEMFAGILGASGRPAVVGYDPAFYFCATVSTQDASGTNELKVGWRDANITQSATYTDYLNYAWIGIHSTDTTDPAPIFVQTGNDGTDVSTSTTNTLADATAVELCTLVSAAGVVTYTIDGSAPTTTAAMTFDDGDSLIPVIIVQQGSDVTTTMEILEWEVGYSL
jgi:hypothetical protein